MSRGTQVTPAARAQPVDPTGASAWDRWLDVVGLLARLALGTLFIVAGALKVGHPLTSARAVQAYDVLPFDLAGLIGHVLPFIEIVLGVLLVLGLFTRFSAAAISILLVLFIAGIAQAWARGLSIDCGCFGGGGAVAPGQTEYPQRILEDLGMLALGVYLTVRPRSVAGLDRRLFGAT